MKNICSIRKKNNTVAKNIVFIMITILFVLISAFFVVGTVQSQSAGKLSVNEEYYLELEREYVREIREYLGAKGFENSGVTLTRVVDEYGNRIYDITLHHRYLNQLDLDEREDLFREIEEMAFSVVNGCFRVKLLM